MVTDYRRSFETMVTRLWMWGNVSDLGKGCYREAGVESLRLHEEHT